MRPQQIPLAREHGFSILRVMHQGFTVVCVKHQVVPPFNNTYVLVLIWNNSWQNFYMDMLSTFWNVDFKSLIFHALYLFEFDIVWYRMWIGFKPLTRAFQNFRKKWSSWILDGEIIILRMRWHPFHWTPVSSPQFKFGALFSRLYHNLSSCHNIILYYHACQLSSYCHRLASPTCCSASRSAALFLRLHTKEIYINNSSSLKHHIPLQLFSYPSSIYWDIIK